MMQGVAPLCPIDDTSVEAFASQYFEGIDGDVIYELEATIFLKSVLFDDLRESHRTGGHIQTTILLDEGAVLVTLADLLYDGMSLSRTHS